jgi:hypothetical protein
VAPRRDLRAELGKPSQPYNLSEALSGESGPYSTEIFVEEQRRRARELEAKAARDAQTRAARQRKESEQELKGKLLAAVKGAFGFLLKDKNEPKQPEPAKPAATPKPTSVKPIPNPQARPETRPETMPITATISRLKDRLAALRGAGRPATAADEAREAFRQRRANRKERRDVGKELRGLQAAARAGITRVAIPKDENTKRAADTLDKIHTKMERGYAW